MRFYPLEKLINLHDASTRQFKIDNFQLLLIQRFGALHLIEPNCPTAAIPWTSPLSTTASSSAPFITTSSPLLTGACCMHPRNAAAACVRLKVNEVGVMLEESG